MDMQQFIQEYYNAWREGGEEQILSFYADNVVIDMLGIPLRVEGRQAMLENIIRPFNAAFPGSDHKIRNLVRQGDQIAVEYILTGVHTGTFAGMPASGRTISLPGCSVYRVQDKRIVRGAIYYNAATLFEQLGA